LGCFFYYSHLYYENTIGENNSPSPEEAKMNIPEGLKPGLKGAVVGAIALAIVGFTWGGWVTGGTAKEMAAEQAKLEVVAALVPICIQQSSQDPQVAETLAQLKGASSYQRSDMLMKAGWATMPGSTEPNRNVAKACIKVLAAQF
jgi:hypothetical protein